MNESNDVLVDFVNSTRLFQIAQQDRGHLKVVHELWETEGFCG